jgi:hypothetical protein
LHIHCIAHLLFIVVVAKNGDLLWCAGMHWSVFISELIDYVC